MDMMDGQWMESEFEKKLHIVRIQNKYPQIGEVVRKMGRLPDEEGKSRLTCRRASSTNSTIPREATSRE